MAEVQDFGQREYIAPTNAITAMQYVRGREAEMRDWLRSIDPALFHGYVCDNDYRYGFDVTIGELDNRSCSYRLTYGQWACQGNSRVWVMDDDKFKEEFRPFRATDERAVGKRYPLSVIGAMPDISRLYAEAEALRSQGVDPSDYKLVLGREYYSVMCRNRVPSPSLVHDIMFWEGFEVLRSEWVAPRSIVFMKRCARISG